MIQVKVHQIDELTRLFEQTPKEAKIILWRAINRAATAGRTRASVNIRKLYFISATDIKSKIKIRKATTDRLNAEIRASGPVTPLLKFDTVPRFPDRMVVRARVKKQGSKKPITNGFVTRVSNGHMNVFTRVGSSRFPIRGLYGPSIAQMMDDESNIKDIQSRSQKVLDERLGHELGRLLRGGA